jgi:hypothetical protein
VPELQRRHGVTTPKPFDLREALVSARHCMAFSSQDWSTNADFAWLYGILVGWSDDEGDALPQLAERFGWRPEIVERLRRHRAAVNEYAPKRDRSAA